MLIFLIFWAVFSLCVYTNYSCILSLYDQSVIFDRVWCQQWHVERPMSLYQRCHYWHRQVRYRRWERSCQSAPRIHRQQWLPKVIQRIMSIMWRVLRMRYKYANRIIHRFNRVYISKKVNIILRCRLIPTSNHFNKSITIQHWSRKSILCGFWGLHSAISLLF